MSVVHHARAAMALAAITIVSTSGAASHASLKAPLRSEGTTLLRNGCQFGLQYQTPTVSPDARQAAFLGAPDVLAIWRARTDSRCLPLRLGVFERFSSESRSESALRWSPDSTSLWVARHEAVVPNGWALTPMQPIKVTATGVVVLPNLSIDGLTLDGLLWADGRGLALAQFGTRGDYYRPEHPDPRPTLAFVDAARGRILQSIPLSSIARPEQGRAPSWLSIRNAAATVDRSGRLHAVLQLADRWAVWVQGTRPTGFANSYGRTVGLRIALSSDGSRLLVAPLLRTEGGVCHRIGLGCQPGRPVTGLLAALHDTDTGRVLWQIRARVAADVEYPAPAIDPRGRYALIAVPPDQTSAGFGLVDLTSGRVLQTVRRPGVSALGFTGDGTRVWAYAPGELTTYAIDR